MPLPDLVLISRRVVTPEGIRPAAVIVRDGHIVEVGPHPAEEPHGADASGAAQVHDFGDLVVLPGLVDSHVHINEPGRTHWEGFATATRAAAAGGITTLVDMPLNCLPPTTTLAALTEKRDVAAPQAAVDLAFWGGAVPGNDEHLDGLFDAGVSGFKAFLADSGVDEYAYVEPAGLAALVGRAFALGATLIVHAEHPDLLTRAAAEVADDVAAGRRDPRAYRTWLDSRPPQAEERAIAALIAAARGAAQFDDVWDPGEYSPTSHTSPGAGGGSAGAGHTSPGAGGGTDATGRAHVLHLSAASSGRLIAQAKADGVAITAETCPHYLTLASEAIPDGATDHKCAPPIRDRANQDGLWDLLADGTIDAIVSDHSPCPPEDKAPDSGDLLDAWGGIASLQLGLSLVWTQARTRGFGLDDVVGWMASGPARIAGLDGKGSIAPGADADLVVFDPDATWTIDRDRLHHRHPITPYHGREVRGAVRRTYLGGHLIAQDGEVVGPPRGQLRRRSEA